MGPSGELPEGDPGRWARARRLQAAHATDVGEEGLHDGRVFHDGDDPQPAATAGTEARTSRAKRAGARGDRLADGTGEGGATVMRIEEEGPLSASLPLDGAIRAGPGGRLDRRRNDRLGRSA
jgi:hypothetical protein